MKRIKLGFVIIPLVVLLTNCSKSGNQTAHSNSLESDSSSIRLSERSNEMIQDSDSSTAVDLESDSILLAQLIRQVYTWRASNRLDDFPYLYDDSVPKILMGIDWNLYEHNKNEMIEAGFFTQ